jgi:hypothetical protein
VVAGLILSENVVRGDVFVQYDRPSCLKDRAFIDKLAKYGLFNKHSVQWNSSFRSRVRYAETRRLVD